LLYGISDFQFGATPASRIQQVAKIDVLRKLKQRFGRKVIRDVCLRVN
jgi:hypothetical protein